MATPVSLGQIWCDQTYYLNAETGKPQSKYVIALAITQERDVLHAVFTSQPNGLKAKPACSTGLPRAGHYVGYVNNLFTKETWVDFSSIRTLDNLDLGRHLSSGKKIALPAKLEDRLFCAILRCATQLEDITHREKNWIYQSISTCNCK